MLVRTRDASALNVVANHPSVRPWLGGEGALDLSPITQDESHVALQNAHGGLIFVNLGAGRYEVHSLFLPEGRGKQLFADIRGGLRSMFIETDCMDIVTKVPKPNKAAYGMARLNGFREIFHRDDGSPHFAGPVSYQRLAFDDWRARDSVVESVGRASPFSPRTPDLAHDRALGAAILMARANNPLKGVLAYNHWASFAGCDAMSLVQDEPCTIAIRDTVFEV